jgi:hypothetical protein
VSAQLHAVTDCTGFGSRAFSCPTIRFLTRKVENKHGKNTQKNDPTHNLKDTSKVYSCNK